MVQSNVVSDVKMPFGYLDNLLNLLIIDDDLHFSDVLQEIFEPVRLFRLHCASSSADTLNLIKTLKRPHVGLLDLGIADGCCFGADLPAVTADSSVDGFAGHTATVRFETAVFVPGAVVCADTALARGARVAWGAVIERCGSAVAILANCRMAWVRTAIVS